MQVNNTTDIAHLNNNYTELVKRILFIERSLDKDAFDQDNIYIDLSDLMKNEKDVQKSKSISYVDVVKYLENGEKGSIHLKHSLFSTSEKQTNLLQHEYSDSKIEDTSINLKDLVLPTLSIVDQISELERIIRAINENVLDNKHMQIVAEEAYGLKLTIDKNNKNNKNKSNFDVPIEILRNQRLSDVLSEIR